MESLSLQDFTQTLVSSPGGGDYYRLKLNDAYPYGLEVRRRYMERFRHTAVADEDTMLTLHPWMWVEVRAGVRAHETNRYGNGESTTLSERADPSPRKGTQPADDTKEFFSPEVQYKKLKEYAPGDNLYHHSCNAGMLCYTMIQYVMTCYDMLCYEMAHTHSLLLVQKGGLWEPHQLL